MPFAQRERKVAHHLFAMPDGITDAQVLPLFVEQQNGEKIVRDHAPDDVRNVGEQLIQIERLRRDGRDFQQKIEQIAAFAEPYGRFNARRDMSGLFHLRRLFASPVSSMICTLALAPTRFAPAATIARRSASVRMPPEAFTPMIRRPRGASAPCPPRWLPLC